jgi:hypothetical protein
MRDAALDPLDRSLWRLMIESVGLARGGLEARASVSAPGSKRDLLFDCCARTATVCGLAIFTLLLGWERWLYTYTGRAATQGVSGVVAEGVPVIVLLALATGLALVGRRRLAGLSGVDADHRRAYRRGRCSGTRRKDPKLVALGTPYASAVAGDEAMMRSDLPWGERPPKAAGEFFRGLWRVGREAAEKQKQVVDAVRAASDGKTRAQVRVLFEDERRHRDMSPDPIWVERKLDELEWSDAEKAGETAKWLWAAGGTLIRMARSHGIPQPPAWMQPPE